MQLDRLTIKSQEALQEAQRIAQEHSHHEVDGEHLLLALIGQSESLIPDLLEKIGVPPTKLKPDVERELARRHKVRGGAEVYLSPNLKKSLDAAQTEAGKLKDDYISVEHLGKALTRSSARGHTNERSRNWCSTRFQCDCSMANSNRVTASR